MIFLATIKDVAKLANVNISTVSRTLGGAYPVEPETRAAVMAAVKALNYTPNHLAKGLKEGRTHIIALMMPTISETVFPAIARSVEDTARNNGYMVIICNTNEDLEIERMYINKLKSHVVDGFLFTTATKERDYINQLDAEGIPTMLLVRKMEQELDAVAANNFQGAYDGTQFLIKSGCRRIAFLNGELNVDVYSERFEGYQMALKASDIPYDPAIVLNNLPGNYHDVYEAVRELSTRQRFDAVFATTDPRAAGAIRALKDTGRKIPDEIKVLGFGDLAMAETTDPPLSTMAQPVYEMGVRATQRLIEKIESKTKRPPLIETYDVTMHIRKST